MTKQKFSELIEDLVKEKEITYLEAITWYCEKFEFEIETAAKLVSPKIRAHLELEAQDLNYIEKHARLPM